MNRIGQQDFHKLAVGLWASSKSQFPTIVAVVSAAILVVGFVYDGRFDDVNNRFAQVDARFNHVDDRLERLESKLDEAIDGLDARMTQTERNQARLEGAIDVILAIQSRDEP